MARSSNSDDDDNDSLSSFSSSCSSSAGAAAAIVVEKKKARKSSSKSDKREKKSKKRRRRDDDKHRRERSKRRKKDKKKKRRHGDDDDDERDDKKRKKKRSSRSSDEVEQQQHQQRDLLKRNYELGDALMGLFQHHPALATDLPIMLIRMAGRGTTFDLGQMTDTTASHGLARVFACLRPYGVVCSSDNGNGDDRGGGSSWRWVAPAATSSSSKNNSNSSELVLVKVVRALLDQMGITMEAVDSYERDVAAASAAAAESKKKKLIVQQRPSTETNENNGENEMIQSQTHTILQMFPPPSGKEQAANNQLATELRGICERIVEGEMIAIDGLPDERLRAALETLFASCGLEKEEMDDDDDEEEESDDDDDDDDDPVMGYGLPAETDGQNGDAALKAVIAKLDTVMDICKESRTTLATTGNKKPMKGPMPMPASYQIPEDNRDADESDDDVGPLPEGAASQAAVAKRGVDKDLVRAKAEQNRRELDLVKSGMDPAEAARVAAKEIAGGEGGREEWMLVPGKFDFLSSVKTGQAMRNRTFEGKSKRDKPAPPGTVPEKPVDPAVKSEINAIMDAYKGSRGPSLLDQHRMEKARQQEEAKASGKDKSWAWNREKDLDAGRRVDKDALNLVFGGAKGDLQKKFAKSFTGR